MRLGSLPLDGGSPLPSTYKELAWEEASVAHLITFLLVPGAGSVAFSEVRWITCEPGDKKRWRRRVWKTIIPDTTCLGLPGRTAAPERSPKPPPQLIGIYGSPMECLGMIIPRIAQHNPLGSEENSLFPSLSSETRTPGGGWGASAPFRTPM